MLRLFINHRDKRCVRGADVWMLLSVCHGMVGATSCGPPIEIGDIIASDDVVPVASQTVQQPQCPARANVQVSAVVSVTSLRKDERTNEGFDLTTALRGYPEDLIAHPVEGPSLEDWNPNRLINRRILFRPRREPDSKYVGDWCFEFDVVQDSSPINLDSPPVTLGSPACTLARVEGTLRVVASEAEVEAPPNMREVKAECVRN